MTRKLLRVGEIAPEIFNKVDQLNEVGIRAARAKMVKTSMGVKKCGVVEKFEVIDIFSCVVETFIKRLEYIRDLV
jgi:hypothetical protein